MKFVKAEPDENFDIAKWVSENNIWELGLHRVLFGIRVVANPVGDFRYAINYCAGDDESFALMLLAMVFHILSMLPEDITAAEVKKLMPTYERRPISLDPCWEKLIDLASDLEKTNTSSDNANKVFADTAEECDRI